MTAIIVIEPRSSGTALVASAVRLGVATHVFSANCDEPPLSRKLQAATVPYTMVDTASPNAVAVAACAIGVDAIVPGCEYATGVAAESAALHGLPHLQPEAAALTRDKYYSRMHLAAAALAVPVFALIAHHGDVMTAALHVGFPAVLKPVRGGGMHVTYVNSLSQLQLAVDCAMHHGVVDIDHKTGNVLLLEQYLEGPEYCVEGYVGSQHGPRVVAVTENLLGAEQNFTKLGHFVEASLTADQGAALVNYVEHAAAQIGLTVGVFHAKVRITRDGPVLIKIAACLGGDRIYRLIELSRSISLPEIAIRSHLGDPEPAPDADAKPAVCVSGVRFFTPVGDAAAVERVRAIPGFQEVEVHSHIGGTVPLRVAMSGRVGHVLFIAPDRPTLDLRLAEALRTLGSRRACKDI
ncbi:ATP-grasp domain-containing protein [Paraburkholderia guartelaensis]|uniref:ATP-grasp domain-containing protein n=1 Tax=Paraburkholderia guartelaensis TaxID=2546446 RepID=A0A4R5L2G4_9BURK|nr:ATP-grasp domain-containing protein [Paraburkholderia guartelaensis]TDG02777.1 ATP-grasp domain-containing protein [Paraburkholderia guartelaensis]